MLKMLLFNINQLIKNYVKLHIFVRVSIYIHISFQQVILVDRIWILNPAEHQSYTVLVY